MFSRSFFALLALGAAMPALAQTAPAPGAPPAAAPMTMPMPAPAPIAADWSRKDAADLLAFVQGVDEEGLDPADYNPAALRDAIDAKGETLDTVATATFLKLAGAPRFGPPPA